MENKPSFLFHIEWEGDAYFCVFSVSYNGKAILDIIWKFIERQQFKIGGRDAGSKKNLILEIKNTEKINVQNVKEQGVKSDFAASQVVWKNQQNKISFHVKMRKYLAEHLYGIKDGTHEQMTEWTSMQSANLFTISFPVDISRRASPISSSVINPRLLFCNNEAQVFHHCHNTVTEKEKIKTD